MGTASMISTIANTFSMYKCQDPLVAYSPKATSPMAIFEILAIFKGGHYSKEGHRKRVDSRTSRIASPLPSVANFAPLLDYTSNALRRFIWGESAQKILVMAILWLKRLSRQSINFHISLITLHLQDFTLFEEHWSRFGDLCLSSDKAGTRQ